MIYLVALHVVIKGMKILHNLEDDSLLQQYVSEGPAFNQRGQQHMPPSLFKAGQGIFAEAASQFARRKEQDTCTWPSYPKTTTLMPRLAVKVSATYLQALEDPM